MTCAAAKPLPIGPAIGSDMSSWNSLLETPAQRLSFWNEAVNAGNGVEIICATTNFIGRMSNRSLGRCAIHSVNIDTAHRAIRTQVRDDLCFVNIQLQNDGALFCGVREMPMPPGSMMIYDAAQSYELDFRGASESLILSMPRSELARRMPDLELHLTQTRSYEPRLIALLVQMMRGIMEAPIALRQSVLDQMTEALLSMLVATLYQAPDLDRRVPTHGAAAMLTRIKAFVQANLSNPDLGPQDVADAMGITVSHLHKIFLVNNATLMQFVLSERLERCRQDIAKSDRTGGISQIAYAWGFNDASHFSRSFRKQFGVSPREYRAAVAARDAELKGKLN